MPPTILSDLPSGFAGVLMSCIIFIPAGISNMSPVLANKIPGYNRWNTPMDFGKSLGKVRIFGDHKTWRGFVAGTTAGTLIGILLFSILSALLDSSATFGGNLLLSLALSAGALLGDAIKSFFKRRSGVPSGKSWFPFDQLDYIIGALVCIIPFGLSLFFAASVLPVYFGLHLLFTNIGFILHLKNDPI